MYFDQSLSEMNKTAKPNTSLIILRLLGFGVFWTHFRYKYIYIFCIQETTKCLSDENYNSKI